MTTNTERKAQGTEIFGSPTCDHYVILTGINEAMNVYYLYENEKFLINLDGGG